MGPHAQPSTRLHGREPQLAQIQDAIRAVATSRRSRVLLTEAPVGAGKTRLLREAVAMARTEGFAVGGSEAGPAASRPSGETPATGWFAPDSGVPGQDSGSLPVRVSFAIEAARAGLRNDSEHPTVVVLDDLDVVSLPVLDKLCDLVVARGGRPILWLLAFTRNRDSATGLAGTAPDPSLPTSESAKAAHERLRGRIAAEQLTALEPLNGEALAQLVADDAGGAPDEALLGLAESVNATPRAVRELVRGLVEDGDIQVFEGTARLAVATADRTSTGAGLPAPVPARFSALIHQELRNLSDPTVKALRLAAILGSPFSPEDLSAMLSEGPVGLLVAVDEAVAHGLLVCGEHDLAFSSEPIWRVLLDSVPLPVCALLRRQVAESLLSRPDGTERAALQLIHVAQPGDTETLRTIAEGARRMVTGDPSTAAALAVHCMGLVSVEHPDRTRLARTGVEAYTRAGELDRAIALARAAIEEAELLPARCSEALTADLVALRASMSTALLLLGDTGPARAAAAGALEGCGQHDAVVTYLAAGYLTGHSSVAQQTWRILSSPEDYEAPVLVGAMTFYAFGQWRQGQVREAVRTLTDACALDCGDQGAPILDPNWFLALALTRTDEFELAEAVIQRCERTTPAGDGTLAAGVPAVLRASLRLAQGRLGEAAQAAQSVVADHGTQVPMLAPQAWLVLAAVALRTGELAQAEEHLRTLADSYPQDASSPWWSTRLMLAAQLAEAREDSRSAADMLAEIAKHPEPLRELVLEDSTAAAFCVRIARAADRPELARTVLAATERLSCTNADVAAVVAASVHARALAAEDRAALAEAAELHRNPWARAAAAEDLACLLLERSRSTADEDRAAQEPGAQAAGAFEEAGDHRPTGRDEDHGAGEKSAEEAAIGELDRAMAAYAALGSERDAARVRARLRSLGVRRRHWTHVKRPVSGWESLTKTERKVAELVAEGLTNRQAARHLFVSPHTVGFHLRQIYRKLGIQSRTALVRSRAEQEPRTEAAPPRKVIASASAAVPTSRG
ncbi:LuxR C-terminal-related transcriptional regulator [Streptomyces sp. XM4193]|uniref:helix-turn-helix transcriptional regulator n=1 Tax=Streptomyces sp. XM4193 TaxID=2929782 RepID=UPI001FFA4270|nr:LuxR family transcriptional regulator [Streptomyces sp. XM4193]MCK1798033.1 LuxR C-terminal-related transcriptional regulator [Streptomyces sp. XM4193]